AMALARNPLVGGAIKNADYDVVSHGWRRNRYQHMDEANERQHMQQAITVLRDLFGKAPLGWYTGRDSPNTRRLVVEQGGLLYGSDYYGDDLPFWTEVQCANGEKKTHLLAPYTIEANDRRYASPQGFNTG
ncbi:allantoinase, partial [Serratia quinivorans]